MGESAGHIYHGRAPAQKNDLKPWQRTQWCIARITSGYIMCMEDVLDLYAVPYDPDYPQICMDERPCMLLGDTLVPIPMKPGKRYAMIIIMSAKASAICSLQ